MLNAQCFDEKEYGFCIIEMLFDKDKQPLDYRFLSINRNFENQTGLKQVLGRRMRELVPNHDKHWFEIYGRTALTGEAIYFEHYASALERWYEVYAFSVEQLENQNRVGIFFREIKELKFLATSLNNLRSSCNQAIAAEAYNRFYDLDFKGEFIFVSNKLSQKLGYTESELVGKTISAIMHPHDVAKNLKLLERMATKSLTYRLKQQLLCRDNSTIAVKIIAFPIFNAANVIEFIRAVVIDNSEAQKLESRLRKSERGLSLMAEITPDVFWIRDYKESQILYISPSYEKVWRRSRDELYQDPDRWIETVHPEDRQRFLATTANYDYLDGERLEYRILRPDGSVRWISDRGYAVRDGQRKIDRIMGIARDISDRKQAQLQLEQSNQILKFLSETAINLLKHSNPKQQIINLLNRLVPLLQLKCYYFYLLSEDKMHLRLELSQGIDEVTRRKMQVVNLDESVCSVVFESQGRLEIDNVQNLSDPRYDLLRSLGITAHACYTIIVNDNAVGVISFSRDTDNSFSAEEITWLRTVSDLVSIAQEQSIGFR